MKEEIYIHRINNPQDNYSYQLQTCYNLNMTECYVENVGGSLEKCEIEINEDSPFFCKVKTPTFVKNPRYLKVIIKLN